MFSIHNQKDREDAMLSQMSNLRMGPGHVPPHVPTHVSHVSSFDMSGMMSNVSGLQYQQQCHDRMSGHMRDMTLTSANTFNMCDRMGDLRLTPGGSDMTSVNSALCGLSLDNQPAMEVIRHKK